MSRVGAVVGSAVAMLALLLGLAAFALGRADRGLAYVAVVVVSVALVSVLMRREVRRRRAEEELLPPERRPARRTPRRPITFPARETAVVFAAWYVAVVAIDRLVTGTTAPFTLAAIAPFAAFMLTTITVAGRHMAFRMTAEEAEGDGEEPAPGRAGRSG